MTAYFSTRNSTIVRTEMSGPALRRRSAAHPALGELVIRTLEPSDVELIEAMSADLSPRSLAQRFFAGTPRIPSGLLRQLGRVDHDRLEAVVAVVGTRVIGLAEYVRTGPATAEFAVMVADRWQHAGIGRRLVAALADLAMARRITHFQADVLPENMTARRMVASFWPAVTPTWDEDCLRYLLPLRKADATRIPSAIAF